MKIQYYYLLTLLMTLSNCQSGGGTGGTGGTGVSRGISYSNGDDKATLGGTIFGCIVGGLCLIGGSYYFYRNRYDISCTSSYLSKRFKPQFLSSFNHSNSTNHSEIIRLINNDKWDGKY